MTKQDYKEIGFSSFLIGGKMYRVNGFPRSPNSKGKMITDKKNIEVQRVYYDAGAKEKLSYGNPFKWKLPVKDPFNRNNLKFFI